MPKHSSKKAKRDRSRSRCKKRRRSRSISVDNNNDLLKQQLITLQRRLDVLEKQRPKQMVVGECSGTSSNAPSRGGTADYEDENQSMRSDAEDGQLSTQSEIEDEIGENGNTQNTPTVSANILALYGPLLNTELMSRWKTVLINGLSEEKRKELIQKYPPPENFTTLSPPLLNPEVKDAINNSVVRRDERLSLIQKQIDATLSAIGLVITSILQEEGGGQNYTVLQSLGDAGRLLADLHYVETKARRELTLLNLDAQLKDTFTAAPVTNHLFGENLDERINAAKNLKKFSQGLKPSVKPYVRPTQSTLPKKPVQKPLNYKSLPRPAQANRQGRRQNSQQGPYKLQQGQYNRYHQRSQIPQRTLRKDLR